MMTQSIDYRSTSGLRVAIVGLGRMGVRHIEAARNLQMDVVGVVDTRAEALAAVQKQFSIPSDACYSDNEQMLREVRPDAVVVATTAPTHAPFVMEAARARVRYILCEKPLAISLAEAEAMVRECEMNGVRLAVNHQMRYMPQYTDVKHLIGTEALGTLVSILVAGSNFGLAMNGSHYFEMFRYISGKPVQSVQAWLEESRLENPRGPQFEDRSGRLLARARSGETMYVDFSSGAGWGLQVVYVCRLGQITVDELNGEMRVAAREVEYRDLPTSRYGMPAHIYSRQIEPASTVRPTMDVWSDLLAGAGYPDVDVGVHALRCLVAAHVSHDAGGRPVLIDDEELPRERKFPWA